MTYDDALRLAHETLLGQLVEVQQEQRGLLRAIFAQMLRQNDLLGDIKALLAEQCEDARRSREEMADPEKIKQKQLLILQATQLACKELGVTPVAAAGGRRV